MEKYFSGNDWGKPWIALGYFPCPVYKEAGEEVWVFYLNMTEQVAAYVAQSGTEPILPGTVPRRAIGPNDVSIKIKYCGICHSDVSLYRNEWGVSAYPICPGHEITGIVESVGENVTKFAKGDRAGIGCIVDSCRTCDNCKNDLDNYCHKGFTTTFGMLSPTTGENQYGGYSERIVVDENYVLRIPESLDLAAAAPLLCAGITTYSPLVDAKVTKGTKVGVVGIGGLGHVAIKLARALGAEVHAFTTKESKRPTIEALGAHKVIVTTNEEQFTNAKTLGLDVIIDTVSGPHELMPYFNTMRPEGTYAMVGLGSNNLSVPGFPLVMKGLYLHGSAVGSIKRTQDMLDLCGEHNITADIEMAHLPDLPTLYERVDKGDVKYRFVLDIEKDFEKAAQQ